jgi:hypothetical protein
MHNHEDEPTWKSNRATLARVKKEMDLPRMTESVREEEEKTQPEHAGVGKAAITPRGKASQTARARANAPEGGNNAKLTIATRDRMSSTKFAFPKQRKEPLENASHVRNAAARFAQVQGVTEAERHAAWKRIQSAAKRYGVELQKSS